MTWSFLLDINGWGGIYLFIPEFGYIDEQILLRCCAYGLSRKSGGVLAIGATGTADRHCGNA
jgi:hypothetical protein